MYHFLFFYANMIVNKNEVLNKVKLKLKLNTSYGLQKILLDNFPQSFIFEVPSRMARACKKIKIGH